MEREIFKWTREREGGGLTMRVNEGIEGIEGQRRERGHWRGYERMRDGLEREGRGGGNERRL